MTTLPAIAERHLPLGLLITLLTHAIAPAQVAQLTLPTNDPRSVIVTAGSHLIISDQVNGQQLLYDIATPSNPTLTATINPPFGDQWFEAEYTPDFGGRLFTGHRFGGLNMLDTSNPAAPTVAASVSTIYHYRGLKYRNFGGQSYLYYAETNWGLSVYSVGANSLSPLWSDFSNANNDANGMEVVGQHLFLYGTPYNRRSTRELKTYDLVNPAAPLLINTLVQQQGGSVSGHCQLRVDGTGTVLLASRQLEGLDLIDIGNPAAPVVTQVIPADPNVSCWGAFAFPNTPFAIIYGWLGVGAAATGWAYFVVVTPSAIVPIGGGTIPYIIRDIAQDPATGRLFIAARTNPTPTGTGVLYVY
ncbi:MAG: hypothetical protein IPK26_06465 [Planctomycetes bacterium]|nr:hypothetical protein [Planctomycetota bacterium]